MMYWCVYARAVMKSNCKAVRMLDDLLKVIASVCAMCLGF